MPPNPRPGPGGVVQRPRRRQAAPYLVPVSPCQIWNTPTLNQLDLFLIVFLLLKCISFIYFSDAVGTNTRVFSRV